MKSALLSLVFVLGAWANADQTQPVPPPQTEDIAFQAMFEVATCVKTNDQKYNCDDFGTFQDMNLKLEKDANNDFLHASARFEKSVGVNYHMGNLYVVKGTDEHYGPYYAFYMTDAFGKQQARYANANVYADAPQSLNFVVLVNEPISISDTEIQIPYMAIAPAGMSANKVRAQVMRAIHAKLQ